MSSPAGAVCPTCRAAIAPGSSFCTRCGSAVGVVEIAQALGTGQQWGGPRRRDRRTSGPAAGAAGAIPAAAGAPAPAGYGVQPGAVAVMAPGALPGGQAGYLAPASALPGQVVLPHHPALGPAFDGVTPAGAGRRVGAYTLDLLAVGSVGAVVAVLIGPVYAGLAALELALGLVVWEARTGRTLGNALLGLRSAKEEAPFAPGLGRAVGRALLLGASHLTGVGQWLVVASGAFDRSGRGQAWHDRAVGTLVVDTRALRAAEARTADPVPVPAVTGLEAASPVAGSAAAAAGLPPTPYPPVAAPPAALPPTPYPPVAAPPAALPPTPYPAVAAPAAGLPPTPYPPVAAPPTAVPPAAAAAPRPAVGGHAAQPAQPVRPPAAAPVAPPQARPVQPPATAPAAPAPVARPAAAQPVAAQPTAAQPTAAAGPAARPTARPTARPAARPAYYVLKVDNGQVFTVTGSGLLGRRPQAPAGEAYDHVLEVEDAARSLSRTHARFGIDATGFWVEDRGSANGTSVQTEAGWSACAPGRRVPVAPGFAIRLGDRTIVVEAAG